MKKNNVNKVIGLLACVLATSSIYAGTINFNQKDEYEFFYCTISGYSITDTIQFDTRNISSSGFCGGQPHVLKPGHLKGLPVDDINNHYFQVKKDREFLGGKFGIPKYKEGSMDYGITNGKISCYHQSSAIQGKTVYGDGHTFC